MVVPGLLCARESVVVVIAIAVQQCRLKLEYTYAKRSRQSVQLHQRNSGYMLPKAAQRQLR